MRDHARRRVPGVAIAPRARPRYQQGLNSAGAMSKPADNPADPFKKALAEATRAMAGEPELTVAYSVDPPGCAAGNMRLPQVTRRMTRDEVMLARGTADAYALRLRYHDDATHRRYAPEGEMAVALFEAMETARCEAMGARAMPGTAGNIDAKIADEARRLGYAEITDPGRAPLAQAAGYLVRHLATGRTLPAGAQNVMELWRGFLDSHAGGDARGPRRRARRPAGLRPLRAAGDRGPRLRRPARRGPGRRRRRRRGGRTRRRRPAAGAGRRGRGPVRGGGGAARTRLGPAHRPAGPAGGDGRGRRQPTSPRRWTSRRARRPSGARRRRTRRPTRATRSSSPASTRRSPPRTSPTRSSSSGCAPTSTSSSSRLKGAVARLANRLQRRLQAQQNRAWDFDLEEGTLDAGRLARVVANPMTPL